MSTWRVTRGEQSPAAAEARRRRARRHGNLSAMSADAFGMGPDRSHFDGYCADEARADLIRRFHLVDDPRGNATIRVTNLLKGELGGRSEMPVAVVAADLAESIEARERSAGRRVLEQALDTSSCPTNEG